MSTLQVVFERPPMFAEIAAAFPVADNGVIFAWGDRIYNPSRIEITPALMAHEEVHGRRQMAMGEIERWWWQYITNPGFRLHEELPAHAAELSVMQRDAVNRHQRRSAVKIVAKKLAAPLYGGLVSPGTAQSMLLAVPHA